MCLVGVMKNLPGLIKMVISAFAWSVLHFVPLDLEAWQRISMATPNRVCFGWVGVVRQNLLIQVN